MPFLCSAVAKPTLPHCIYVGQLILTLCYLEGPTKELVSPSKFILPSGENMPTSQRFVLQGSPFVRLARLSGANNHI